MPPSRASPSTPSARPGHESWVVVLHVPGFAALHAVIHDGACLDVVTGPELPAGAEAGPAQVDALLHHARDLADDGVRASALPT